MRSKKIHTHLKNIGDIITEGLTKLAGKHDLKLKILPPPQAIVFSFDYGKESQAIRTLFTQEMLKRGFLASNLIYVSYAHKSHHVRKYLRTCDEVFGIIIKAIQERKVRRLLKGPVAHSGFKRLT